MTNPIHQLNQTINDAIKHSDTVKKCIQPLAQFGISFFCYIFTKNNGDSLFLSSHPEIDEFYFDEKLYNHDAYSKHPSNYQTGFYLLDSEYKESFNQSLKVAGDQFDLAPCIGYCEKQEDAVGLYAFWGAANTKQRFDQVLPHYTRILKPFIQYFHENCDPLLEPDKTSLFSLGNLVGPEFMSCSIPTNNTKNFHQYLRSIGFGNEVQKASILSRREKECIRLLLKGQSAKETAATLQLSHRTIEHYLDNIKLKLGCQYKHQVFSEAAVFNELFLL